MKRFTSFTFLYLALGVCLTAIALGYPNLSSSLQTNLLISAGASYIVCFLSTFSFWREMTIRVYRRQNSVVILPWLVIGFNIIWMIWEVQSQNWTSGSSYGWSFSGSQRVAVRPVLQEGFPP
ncbi:MULTISPECIES: hypothetical protein [Brasilonema]|uniref:hypothetical protein n=1 Tax=Brasilonema TaxID=383614 RepID=UPI001FE89A8F|nr:MULTISPECIES: hypothetical protein [Brasilonema]